MSWSSNIAIKREVGSDDEESCESSCGDSFIIRSNGGTMDSRAWRMGISIVIDCFIIAIALFPTASKAE